MSRRMSLDQWREWRRTHYSNGDPRDELGPLLLGLLATRRGSIALLRAERRYAKNDRRQHTASPHWDAAHPHQAYGRKRSK